MGYRLVKLSKRRQDQPVGDNYLAAKWRRNRMALTFFCCIDAQPRGESIRGFESPDGRFHFVAHLVHHCRRASICFAGARSLLLVPTLFDAPGILRVLQSGPFNRSRLLPQQRASLFPSRSKTSFAPKPTSTSRCSRSRADSGSSSVGLLESQSPFASQSGLH